MCIIHCLRHFLRPKGDNPCPLLAFIPIDFIMQRRSQIIQINSDAGSREMCLGECQVSSQVCIRIRKSVGRQADSLLHNLLCLFPFFNVPTNKRNLFHAFQ